MEERDFWAGPAVAVAIVIVISSVSRSVEDGTRFWGGFLNAVTRGQFGGVLNWFDMLRSR